MAIAELRAEDDDEPITHGRRRGWWMALGMLLALVSLIASRVPGVQAWARGELDWRGRRTYVAEHPPALEQVDLTRVHAELLPRWLIAQGKQAAGEDVAAEPAAFAELRAAVAPDANLAALLDELHELSAPSRLGEAPRRALYLTWAWSHYLDRHGAPFLVLGNVRARDFGPLLTATIHRVHADVAVAVGEAEHRVRITSRVDGTNLREAYLGAAGHDDAVVVVDRLRDFTLDEVWPLLDPWLELRSPVQRSFAAAIRAEVSARLSPVAVRRLENTATVRSSIAEVVRGIEARRRDCDSGLRIDSVPWYGLPPVRLTRLAVAAEHHAERECPGITAAEVQVLARATEALEADVMLETALEELVALTAEHVAIHEARHLADAEHADGFDEPLPCAPCSEAMGITARAELSGYLASLAWSPAPALALYQACRSLAPDQGKPLEPGEPHREALDLLQRRIGLVCAKGPPEELQALARHLEVEMLGRSDAIALPESFPRRLPLGSEG
ncbi:MAG TPA: hypothetical protein VEA99_16820 [Gemmatimonadaceae bacterium]|nr:hypothetical protein [Gemmatimonadaceae bacterium]